MSLPFAASTLAVCGSPRDPSIQIIPTSGPKDCKYYLRWAMLSPRVELGDFKLYNGFSLKDHGLGIFVRPLGNGFGKYSRTIRKFDRWNITPMESRVIPINP